MRSSQRSPNYAQTGAGINAPGVASGPIDWSQNAGGSASPPPANGPTFTPEQWGKFTKLKNTPAGKGIWGPIAKNFVLSYYRNRPDRMPSRDHPTLPGQGPVDWGQQPGTGTPPAPPPAAGTPPAPPPAAGTSPNGWVRPAPLPSPAPYKAQVIQALRAPNATSRLTNV